MNTKEENEEDEEMEDMREKQNAPGYNYDER